MVLAVAVGAAGCGKFSFNSLKAKKAVREAHDLYRASHWQEATERYEAAIAADPTLPGAHFLLANSYDNLYKPSRAGEKQNDEYIQKAIQWYKVAAEKEPDPLYRRRAMEYLVAAYGPDKLNNPGEAEPIALRMIELDAKEHTNYFALARIYQDAGRYDEAEKALVKAKELKPDDPTVYTTLANFYNSQGEFEKTIEALTEAANLRPEDPQGYQLVAVYYWEKAHKDKRLTPAQTKDYALKGIEATDKALKLNPNYMEAMTYKNILLRIQAYQEKDPVKQAALIKQADELRNKAIEMNRKKATGQGN
jgi:tetratricopeptide (TPR) repeat protein